MSRSIEIKIRVSEEDKKRWVAAAEHSGDSLSSWIRDALDAAAEFVGKDNPHDRLIAKGILSTSKDELVDAAKILVNKKTGGGCSFFTPRGTKCKACGKVHS